MPKAHGKLDIQYAETMQNHPFGIALYYPPPTTVLKPGAVGYFDAYGSWNVIADLEDATELARNGFSLSAGLTKAPADNGIKWGPKTSSSTKATKIDLSAGIDPAPGIPVTASAVYSYHIDSDIGAILLTSAPVTHERYYHSTPFKNWMKDNAHIILDRWRYEAKEFGMWIVTSTFSTRKCAINMWTTRKRGIKVGFSADVAGVGQIGPGVEWYRSHTDEGWGEYSSEGEHKSVVFFGGLRFRFSQNFRKVATLVAEGPYGRTIRRPIEEQLEGGIADSDEDTPSELISSVPDPEDEDKEFKIECENYEEEETDQDTSVD
ncbi:hypothetical protein HYPSUDRAFT_46553 [Hypholoma sublateritium FD-334 SS-4]|uniref:Uncharacterized protein n=1 Tax=Hypholoma sublateritium (strain FD-334 SS-4) TaxID=945553 RepID=A0A0D2PAJ2_HYPSF|nr:hypothetical protein HYPSUDRAFT_46553 [Hypholoma sublateritium FD-334 SS-4]